MAYQSSKPDPSTPVYCADGKKVRVWCLSVGKADLADGSPLMPNYQRCEMKCAWEGRLSDCDPKPDELVRCPQCGEPVSRKEERSKQ